MRDYFISKCESCDDVVLRLYRKNSLVAMFVIEKKPVVKKFFTESNFTFIPDSYIDFNKRALYCCVGYGCVFWYEKLLNYLVNKSDFSRGIIKEIVKFVDKIRKDIYTNDNVCF